MSKTEKSPAFQFYPKDVLSDGNAMAMPADAFGIYMKLLCFDWIDDGLLDDDKTLMRLGGYDWHDYQGNEREGTDYDIIIGYIRPQFEPHPTKMGYITNPRLQKERRNQEDRKKSASDNANKRWQKNGNATASDAHNNGICETDTKSCSSSSSSSSSSNNNINIGDGLIKVGVHTYLTQYSKDLVKKRFLDEGLGNKDIKRAIEYLDKDFEVNTEKRYPIRDHRLDLIGWPLDKVRTVKADLDKKKPKQQAPGVTPASESMHPSLRAEREQEAKAALENLGMGGLTK